MTPYVIDKRSGRRVKREIAVQVKTKIDTKRVFTIDFSQGGVKIGGALLKLPLGEPVDLLVTNGGENILFSGRVEREDGLYHISRIGRDANTFFIHIVDADFREFVTSNYHI